MGPRGVLTDDQWAVIEELLPPVKGEVGRPSRPHRPVVEGIIYRYRAGIRGGIYPGTLGRGRRCGSGTTNGPPTEPGIGCWPRSWPTRTRPGWWTGRSA